MNFGLINSIPDDQWIRELYDWESIVWAAHQTMLVDNAIGPTIRDPFAESYFLQPTTQAERELCGMQKMRKQGGFV